jgi:hypothetical protein
MSERAIARAFRQQMRVNETWFQHYNVSRRQSFKKNPCSRVDTESEKGFLPAGHIRKG